jgi:hypothetical protein
MWNNLLKVLAAVQDPRQKARLTRLAGPLRSVRGAASCVLVAPFLLSMTGVLLFVLYLFLVVVMAWGFAVPLALAFLPVTAATLAGLAVILVGAPPRGG